MSHPFRVNGADFAYVVEGRGEWLILVHGSLSDFRVWEEMIAPLAAKYRVIAYSRRCHSPNECPRDAKYTLEQHVADLTALLPLPKEGPVHLVGHSSGGAIVAALARKHSELVRSVILIEPGVYSMLPETDQGRRVRAEIGEAGQRARQALAHDQDEEAIRQLMDLVFRPRKYSDLVPWVREVMLANAPSLRAAVVSAAPAPDFTCADAAKISVPVLLLEGEKTAPEFRLINDQFARCLKKQTRVVIPGASHGLVFEHPRETAEAILRFLQNIPGGKN